MSIRRAHGPVKAQCSVRRLVVPMGSYALNEAGRDSDIDIIVIVDDPNTKTHMKNDLNSVLIQIDGLIDWNPSYISFEFTDHYDPVPP